jgi:hypothetical protein
MGTKQIGSGSSPLFSSRLVSAADEESCIIMKSSGLMAGSFDALVGSDGGKQRNSRVGE